MVSDPPENGVEGSSLYPLFATVSEAIKELETMLPITTRNELLAALNTYHNSLIKESQSQ